MKMISLVAIMLIGLICGCSSSKPPTEAEQWYNMNWDQRVEAGKMLNFMPHMGDGGKGLWIVVTNFPTGKGTVTQTILTNATGARVVAMAGKNLAAGTRARVVWYGGQHSAASMGLFMFPVVEEINIVK